MWGDGPSSAKRDGMLNSTVPALPMHREEAPLWAALEDAVREACTLRAEGLENDAIRILQEVLPGMIGRWSRSASRPAAECQQRLRELFARVQQQVATAQVCKRLVLRSLEASNRQAPLPAAAVRLQRRVPIDDIPGMLDALDEGERLATRRQNDFLSATRTPATTGGAAGRTLSGTHKVSELAA